MRAGGFYFYLFLRLESPDRPFQWKWTASTYYWIERGFAPLQRSGATTITGSFGWFWKQYFGGIKFKGNEPTKKHYTTPPHWPGNSKEPNPRPSTTPPLPTGQKTQKNRTHDQALHHPSPLARKLKRIELTTRHYTTLLHWPETSKGKNPTTKHYTTRPHWPENSKEPNPRPSTTPPLPTGHKTQKNRTHEEAPHHHCQKNHLKYGALNSIDDAHMCTCALG
jgi:hypothetical protein